MTSFDVIWRCNQQIWYHFVEQALDYLMNVNIDPRYDIGGISQLALPRVEIHRLTQQFQTKLDSPNLIPQSDLSLGLSEDHPKESYILFSSMGRDTLTCISE